jgi:hypothetical protein
MKSFKEFLKDKTLAEFVDTKRFTPDEIKKAVAIAKKMENDMTDATEAIENIKKGLSDHPKVAAALRKYNESISEGKTPEYAVYHAMYSDAVSEVIEFVKRRKFEVDMDDFFNKVSSGPRKPSEGKTNSFSVDLTKPDGTPVKKSLHFQVANVGGNKDFGNNSKKPYELNAYIS